jgi:general secretion pathway protein K
MNISLRQNSRDGIALIIAMIALVVLSLLAAGFAYSMKVETKLAQNADSDQQLMWLGRSGVEYARWILAQEAAVPGQPYDSLNEIWAGGPGGAGETNSVLSGISLDSIPIDNGTVSIKMIDLERFANINTANSAELQQVLTLMGVDADDISIVSDSVLDWVQSGDVARLAGAKNDYYQGLPHPYYCKEAPMDDLSELLLVRGIADQPEIYWGGSATNHAPATFQHQLGLANSPGQPADYPFGFKDVFTPFSTGRININTAGTNVLQMIPGIDPNIAASIVQQRAGPDGVDGTEDDTPFQSVNQLVTAGVNPAIVSQLGRICAVRSFTFEVHVTAQIGTYRREFVAILYRTGTDVQVLGFHWQQPNNPAPTETPAVPAN